MWRQAILGPNCELGNYKTSALIELGVMPELKLGKYSGMLCSGRTYP